MSSSGKLNAETINKIKSGKIKSSNNYKLVEGGISGPISRFIENLKDWRFNLPANNLWTVEINLHNDGSADKQGEHTFKELYAEICAANRGFDEQIGGFWKIESPNDNPDKDFNESFIGKMDGIDGVFLAQGVKFTPHKAQINTDVATQLVPYSGFMTWGMVTNGKVHGYEANIQFLETNWNIGEILFDKWIAAILQQGLVEDVNLKNIKSDIIIKKYAPSVPSNMNNKVSSKDTEWKLRQTIVLYKAVPLSYERINELNYESPSGPNTVTVNFNYNDYSIKYHI